MAISIQCDEQLNYDFIVSVILLEVDSAAFVFKVQTLGQIA